jgi:hypothetical protein
MKAPKRRRWLVPNRSLYISFAITTLALSPLSVQQPSVALHANTSSSDSRQAGSTVGNQGPVLSSSEIAQGAVLLHFAHADGGLRLESSGGAFEIAGADHIWFPAEAHLVNGVVVVSTSLVQQPIVVRYHWTSRKTAALFNGANLPAEPFQTDK